MVIGGQLIQQGMARHAEYAYQRAPQHAVASLRRSLVKAVLLCVVAVAGGLCYMYTEAGWAKMQVLVSSPSSSSSTLGGGSLRRPPGRPVVEEWDVVMRPINVVVTHHKTGTELTIRLLRAAHEVHDVLHHNASNGVLMGYFGNKPLTALPHEPPPFFYIDALYSKEMFYDRPDDWHEHFTPKEMDFHHFFQGGPALSVVHLVRDPVDLVVSAYLYHKGGPPVDQEPWLYEQHPLSEYGWAVNHSTTCHPPPAKTTMSWHEVLTCLGEEEGVRAEIVFQTSIGTLPAMIAAVKSLRTKQADTGGRYMQLGLDDFKEDWDGAVHRLFSFFRTPTPELRMILEQAAPHDLKRKSAAEIANSTHVTATKANRGPLLAVVEAALPSHPVMVEARELFGRRPPPPPPPPQRS